MLYIGQIQWKIHYNSVRKIITTHNPHLLMGLYRLKKILDYINVEFIAKRVSLESIIQTYTIKCINQQTDT